MSTEEYPNGTTLKLENITGGVIAWAHEHCDGSWVSPNNVGVYGKRHWRILERKPAPPETEMQTRIRSKCNELAEMLCEKNRAYGNSAASPMGIFAKRVDRLAQIDVRIDDKLSRLAKGAEYPGDDTIKDLAGYLILRMIVAEE